MAYVLPQNENGIEVFTGNVENDKVVVPDANQQIDIISVKPTGNHAAPKHKNSQQKFLVWVAFVRKQSRKISETERRSCPLKDCQESPFQTHDSMLDHVYTCPRLAKGLYKCCDCGNFERISKIHTKGCHELPRVSRVANSFRRAGRRLLPSHSAKNHNGGKGSTKVQATANPMGELAAPERDWYASSNISEESMRVAELDNASISEIYGNELAEFDTCSSYLPHGEVLAQNACSELSAGQDSVQNSNSQLGSAHGPIELSTGVISTWMAHEDHQFRVQADDQHNLLQDQFQNAVHCYTPDGHITFPELQSPAAVSPISEYDYSSKPSLSNTSRTNTDVSAISFGSFSTSWNSSISSVSTLDSQAGHCKVSPVRFFEGEADMMFSEPDSLEETLESVELPTSSNDCFLDYFGGGSGLMIPELESVGKSFEPAELPTAFNAGPLNHLGAASCLFPPRVELPTSSNASFTTFISLSSKPQSFPLPPSFSKSARSRDIGARVDSKCSPWSAGTLSGPFSFTPPAPRNLSSKYKCPCGFEPRGKEVYKASNLKRHQNTRNCRRFSPYKRPEPTKCFPCPYPSCDKEFTRSDNLRVHQKQKRHLLEIELLDIGAPRWQSEDVLREMQQHYRY